MTRPFVRPFLRAQSSELLNPALILTVAVLALVTVLSVMTTQFRAFAPRVDVAVYTVAAIVTLAGAVLAWARFRELSDPVGLFIAAAFLVLVVADGATLVQLLVDPDGPSVAKPVVHAPLYVAGVAQFMVAGLLIVGTAAALAGRDIKFPLLVLLGPAAVLLTFMALVRLLEPILPALEHLAGGPDLTPGQEAFSELRHPTPLGALLQLALAALFVLAATLARRLYRRRRRAGDGSLVVASVFAAFAEAHAAIYPGISPGYLTGVDVLRLAFLLALFLGLAAEARVALRALRRTNATVAWTSLADAARGGQEERSRLSRELHDGLAQDLWLAKLKVGRLRSLRDIGPEATALSEELSVAIDAGLAEARQAVMALHMPGEGSFSELLSRYVDDFSDAFGLRAEFSCDEDLPALQPVVLAELMRIAQESLNNVRRHADATLIRVEVRIKSDHLRLAIIDNGRGFDIAATRTGAFGLAGMRERALLIGGQLEIESRPQGGTSIFVDLPLPAATTPHPDAES